MTETMQKEVKSLWMQGYCIRSISNKLGVTQKMVIKAIDGKSQFEYGIDEIKQKEVSVKSFFDSLTEGQNIQIVVPSNRANKQKNFTEKILSKKEYFLLTDKKRTVRYDEILTGHIKINGFEIKEIKTREKGAKNG